MSPIIKEFERKNASEMIKSFYRSFNFEEAVQYRIQIYKIDYTGNWTTCMDLKHYGDTTIPNKYFINPETDRDRLKEEGFIKEGIIKSTARHNFIQRIMDNHKIEKIKIVLTPIVILPLR